MHRARVLAGWPGLLPFGWLAVLLAVLGCSQPSPAPPASAAVPRPRPPARISDKAVTGTWRWSLATTQDGVRRIERERWHLTARRGAIEGTYERTVTFLAMSGMPFVCNQDLGYELSTTYQVTGSYEGTAITLREVGYQTAPSPCDDGYRSLGSYRGELVGDSLVLRWPAEPAAAPGAADAADAVDAAGEATLVREPGMPPGVAGVPTPDVPMASLAGSWRWQSHSQEPNSGEIRVEVEDWELSETGPSQIYGTITRTVTVLDAGGRRYDCSGDTYYRYRDRFTVRGARVGSRLSLSEVAVVPDAHPCLVHRERHLDAATGHVMGTYLVLTWRGHRRQVLHRAHRF